MSSWKTPHFAEHGKQRLNLQWSHDDVVVENATLDGENRFGMNFNGATTMSSWKTRHAASDREIDPHFNGATTMSSWKTTFHEQR